MLLKLIIYLCLFAVIFFWSSFWLKISEVYFDWTDEWIELYNDWDIIFTWNLILKWAKTTDIVLNSISICSWWKILLWDEFLNIFDKWNSIWWLWFSIADTKSIDIKIYSWDYLLDSLYIEENLIKSYDNKKTSFERLDQFGTYVLTAVNLDRIHNINWWLVANPWKVFSYSSSSSSQSSLPPQWSLISNVLQITQIGAVSSDYLPEFIQIFASRDYFGTVSIKWLWHWWTPKNVDLKIYSWQSLIISSDIWKFSPWQNLLKIDWISLTDWWEIIDIISSTWLLLDSIYYQNSISDMSNYFDHFSWNVRNFFKIDYPNVEIPFDSSCGISFDEIRFVNESIVDMKIDANSRFCAKPFKKIFSINWVDTSSWDCNYVFWYTWFTWILSKIYYWNQLLCSSDLKLYKTIEIADINFCENKFDGTLKIIEVHPINDEYFDEFIEIIAVWNFSWVVSFGWLWRWEDIIDSSFFLSSWSIMVLSKTTKWISSLSNSKIITQISLKDEWEEIIIYWQDWQILDSFEYHLSSSGKSFFKNIFFDSINQDYPTPWYVWEYVNFNKIVWLQSCYINMQNNSYYYFWNSINLVASLSWVDLSNSNKDYTCHWYTSWVELTWCNPWYFKFPFSGVHNVKLDIYQNSAKICSAQVDINYPKNFVWTSCNEGYYQSLYIKRKDKYNQLYKSKNTIETSSIISDYSWLSIYSILPNPKWKDQDNESITVFNSSWWVFITWLIIEYWKNEYEFTWFELKLWLNVFTWNYLFPNKNACVKMFIFWEMIDKICYKSSSPWKYIYWKAYYESNLNDWEQKSSQKKILSLESLLSKSNKKIESLKKKFDKHSLSIAKLKDRIANSSAKYKIQILNYKQKIKDQKLKTNEKITIYKAKLASIKLKVSRLNNEFKLERKKLNNNLKMVKNQLKLANVYLNLVNKTLKRDWKIIYGEWGFDKMFSIYLLSEKMLKSNKKLITYYWVPFGVYDIEKLYKFATWKISLNEILKNYIILIDDYKPDLWVLKKNLLKANKKWWNYF